MFMFFIFLLLQIEYKFKIVKNYDDVSISKYYYRFFIHIFTQYKFIWQRSSKTFSETIKKHHILHMRAKSWKIIKSTIFKPGKHNP